MIGRSINKCGLYQSVYAIDDTLSDSGTWEIVVGPTPIAAMRADGIVRIMGGIKNPKAIYGLNSVKHGFQWYAEDCVFLVKDKADVECKKRNAKHKTKGKPKRRSK